MYAKVINMSTNGDAAKFLGCV